MHPALLGILNIATSCLAFSKWPIPLIAKARELQQLGKTQHSKEFPARHSIVGILSLFQCHGMPNLICLGQWDTVTNRLEQCPQNTQTNTSSITLRLKTWSMISTISLHYNLFHFKQSWEHSADLQKRGRGAGMFTFKCFEDLLHPGTEKATWHSAMHEDHPTEKLFVAYKCSHTKFIFRSPSSHPKLYRTSLSGLILILSRSGAGTNLSISLGMNIQFKSSSQYRGLFCLGATCTQETQTGRRWLPIEVLEAAQLSSSGKTKHNWEMFNSSAMWDHTPRWGSRPFPKVCHLANDFPFPTSSQDIIREMNPL